MVLDAPPLENSPAKTLIIDTAWLGDVVFTTSLLGAVRKAWPGTELHLLVAPRGEPIVRDHPHVNRLWVYDKAGRDKSLGSLVGLGRRLREEKFDLVLSAHPSARSRLLTRLTQAPVRVGYAGFGARLCFTHIVQNDLAVEPDHVERRIALLRKLGVPATAEPLHVGISDNGRAWAESYLNSLDHNGGPILGLVCSSAWSTKRWPPGNFADIGRKWVHERSGVVVVIAGRQDHSLAQDICTQIGARAFPLIQEPIPNVAAILARCKTVVGNDTGISFLAIAAGCPRVIVLYGSTQVNYAFPPPHQALTAGVPCCLSRTGHGAKRCKWSEKPWCMEQISVERVFGAAASVCPSLARSRSADTCPDSSC